MLEQLATERGPWGRGVEAADLDSVYWMLDPREDDRGRRLKLIRNPHGCRHTIASERTRGVTRSVLSSSRVVSRAIPRWGWRGVTAASAKLADRRFSVNSSTTEGTTEGTITEGSLSEGGDERSMRMSFDGEELEGQDVMRLASRTDVRAISAQTSLWQDLCKYQHKSVKLTSGAGDDLENEDEEEEEEEEEYEEGTDDEYDTEEESTGGVDGSDDGQELSRKRRRKTEGGGGGKTATECQAAAFSSPADVVRPFNSTPGTVYVLADRLVFTRSPEVCSSGRVGAEDGRAGGGAKQRDQTITDNYKWALRPAPSTSWPTLGLRRVLFRPHGGSRFAALELWFRGGVGEETGVGGAEGSSLLLGLPTEALARSLHQELRRTRPPALEPFLGRLPTTVVSRSKAGTWGSSGAGGVGMSSGSGALGHGAAAGTGRTAAAAVAATAAREAARTPLTQAWIRRRCGVTNFDYLRALNAAAGRTTSDLARYPVFPWVLSERAWRAEELDLKDERNFRDLAWPMGAQRPEQREVGRSMRWAVSMRVTFILCTVEYAHSLF